MIPKELLSGFRKSSAVVLVLTSVCYGGSLRTFPDYPSRPVSACAVSAEQAGFAIGVQPMDDPKEQRAYFHLTLKSRGLLPVYVVILNKSRENSLLVDRSVIQSGVGDRVPAPSTSPAMTPELAVGSGVMFGLIGLLTALEKTSIVSEIRQNMIEREIQSRTLPPGAAALGFLYIPVPKNGVRERIRLRIFVTAIPAGAALPVDLVF